MDSRTCKLTLKYDDFHIVKGVQSGRFEKGDILDHDLREPDQPCELVLEMSKPTIISANEELVKFGLNQLVINDSSR